jgi:hypothetical protein
MREVLASTKLDLFAVQCARRSAYLRAWGALGVPLEAGRWKVERGGEGQRLSTTEGRLIVDVAFTLALRCKRCAKDHKIPERVDVRELLEPDPRRVANAFYAAEHRAIGELAYLGCNHLGQLITASKERRAEVEEIAALEFLAGEG